MAEQWFLKVDGIAGESLDDRHRGEIEVLSWSLGAATSGGGLLGGVAGRFGGGAGGARKVSFEDLTVEAGLSAASPLLLLACATGRRIRSVVLAGVRAGGGRSDFATYTFDDAAVTGVHHGDTPDGTPTDRVSFDYARIRVAYRTQRPDGSLGDPVTAGWDVQANRAL